MPYKFCTISINLLRPKWTYNIIRDTRIRFRVKKLLKQQKIADANAYKVDSKEHTNKLTKQKASSTINTREVKDGELKYQEIQNTRYKQQFGILDQLSNVKDICIAESYKYMSHDLEKKSFESKYLKIEKISLENVAHSKTKSNYEISRQYDVITWTKNMDKVMDNDNAVLQPQISQILTRLLSKIVQDVVLTIEDTVEDGVSREASTTLEDTTTKLLHKIKHECIRLNIKRTVTNAVNSFLLNGTVNVMPRYTGDENVVVRTNEEYEKYQIQYEQASLRAYQNIEKRNIISVTGNFYDPSNPDYYTPYAWHIIGTTITYIPKNVMLAPLLYIQPTIQKLFTKFGVIPYVSLIAQELTNYLRTRELIRTQLSSSTVGVLTTVNGDAQMTYSKMGVEMESISSDNTSTNATGLRMQRISDGMGGGQSIIALQHGEDFTRHNHSLAGLAEVSDIELRALSIVCGFDLSEIFHQQKTGFSGTTVLDVNKGSSYIDYVQTHVYLPLIKGIITQIVEKIRITDVSNVYHLKTDNIASKIVIRLQPTEMHNRKTMLENEKLRLEVYQMEQSVNIESAYSTSLYNKKNSIVLWETST